MAPTLVSSVADGSKIANRQYQSPSIFRGTGRNRALPWQNLYESINGDLMVGHIFRPKARRPLIFGRFLG